MKINEKCAIIGKNVVLVPYKKHHVLRYHKWMKSEELQGLTASEPLTLEEEYEMQISWHQDENKLTFIIMDRYKWSSESFSEEGQTCLDSESTIKKKSFHLLLWNCKRYVYEDCMCGDVNLFLNNDEDDCEAEIEIMVAEPSCRGKGFGTEAIYLMMKYGIRQLGLKNLTAKIGCSNTQSMNLFRKLGFEEVSRSEVFQEVTLELPVTSDLRETLKTKTDGSQTEEYESKDKNG